MLDNIPVHGRPRTSPSLAGGSRGLAYASCEECSSGFPTAEGCEHEQCGGTQTCVAGAFCRRFCGKTIGGFALSLRLSQKCVHFVVGWILVFVIVWVVFRGGQGYQIALRT